ANAALYARKLMHYCSNELDGGSGGGSGRGTAAGASIDPSAILARAYDRTMADAVEEKFVGSSTALLAVLTNGDELRVTNLGDCGIAVIRDGELVFRSEEQQHSFNYPYQLGTAAHDTPADAQYFKMHVQHGDIVVMASDGIFDNLFDEEMLAIVRTVVGWPSVSTMGSIAEAIVARAREAADDSRGASPFASRAMREGLYYQGGKVDDVAVVVGVVRDPARLMRGVTRSSRISQSNR
ncbi:phosphatase 2C-like domain-containing protein, partial [Blastocladiella britannica]